MTRVSKLTHDGSNVGPGDYEVEKAHKASKPQTKGSVNLAFDKIQRFVRSDTNMA